MNRLRNRLYYAVKPWIPIKVRWALRRLYSRRLRLRVGARWPILPGSEKPPPKWSGWPEGKQFAVVLTHDVEGPLGLSRCRQLMRLEQELGFRSSFNFIPEGAYVLPDDLRSELQRSGFEIGVHDLHHDGKLYQSRKAFAKSALQINQYLKEWGAVGFRSGFMLHNLEWAHSLNILYEASTFDTDPFEPQPEGVGTVFPFWVPPAKPLNGALRGASLNGSGIDQNLLYQAGQGYIELPYTLAQDSTVFSLLGERHPDIWFQKLDWLAKHGGMVLVNVHPDYSSVNGTKMSTWEYPVEFYKQLLQRLRSNYQNAYWHGTAAELAVWYKATLGAKQNQGNGETDGGNRQRDKHTILTGCAANGTNQNRPEMKNEGGTVSVSLNLNSRI